MLYIFQKHILKQQVIVQRSYSVHLSQEDIFNHIASTP